MALNLSQQLRDMKKQLFLFFCLLSFLGGYAQQDPMYSMYMFNPMAVNPAYAGSLDHAQATGLFRRQWLDFPGSPRTASLSFHTPMKNDKVGLGFSFVNDQMGEMATNSLMASYAYHLKLKKSRLSFGLQAGARNFSIDLNKIKLNPDQSYDESFQGMVSQWSLNFGAGAFWYSDKWYLGLGIPNLRNNLLNSQQMLNTVYQARYRTHFNLSGGYVFKLSPTFHLKPSFMLKEVAGAPMQFDLNANVYWLDLIGFGLSYRSGDAMLALLEIQLNKNFRLGYAYDQTINKMAGYVGGTHEVMLRSDLGFNKNKTITPRYF